MAAAAETVSSLVASIVIRRVRKLRGAKGIFWPTAVRDAGPSRTVNGRPPSKVRVTRVMVRLVLPFWGWTSVTWSVVITRPSWSCHHCPAGSGIPIPVVQLVSRLLSMAA